MLDSAIPRASLFRHSRDVIGYSDLMETNKEWCRKLQADFGSPRRHLALKPRGTYKTSIYTISYPTWIFARDPNRTTLLVQGSHKIVKDTFQAIRWHIRTNPKYLTTYGHIYDSDRSRVDEIWHKYRDLTKGVNPNIRGESVGSNIVGTHYDTIILDDIVTDEDRYSTTIREKTKTWFRDLFSIANPNAEIIIVGTRWHFDDLYHYISEDINPRLPDKDKYTIEVETLYEEDPLTGLPDESRLRFPEVWTHERIALKRIEKGPIEFSAQYMNEPLPDEAAVFPPSVFMRNLYDPGAIDTSHMRIGVYYDPATSEEKKKYVCYAAIVTVGYDQPEGTYYVLDASMTQSKPIDTTIGRDLMRQIVLWEPHDIGVETNIAGSLFKEKINNYLEELDLKAPRITEVSHNTAKSRRIELLDPIFNSDALKFREDYQEQYPELAKQVMAFPLHRYRDGPDALSGAVELVRGRTRRFGARAGHHRRDADKMGESFLTADEAKRGVHKSGSPRMKRAALEKRYNIHPFLRISRQRSGR